MSTVYDDVALGPLNLGLPIDEVHSRVKIALETVGVLDLKDRPSHRLSSGQKRRVAIATVLSMSPDILVMDEPTSGLDPQARRQLIKMLKTFKHSKIIATHDLDLVLDLCERTIILHEGRIQADGPTSEIFHNEKLLADCHLEKPLRMQNCPVCG
jgi:cobalt/nickel transport system ATP-binding protein